MGDPAVAYLSLCSGIGGLDLGLRIAEPGARPLAFVEREAFAASVLLARMAEEAMEPAPIWCGDIQDFDARGFRGRVDVLLGGYPCQPFSTAGRRRGTKDERHIWPEIARIIDECDPTYCFFENVANHIGLGLDVVCRDLVALRRRIAIGLFAAEEVGTSHRRERLFILAHADRRSLRLEPERHQQIEAQRRDAEPGESGAELGNAEGGARRLHVPARRSREPDTIVGRTGPAVADADGLRRGARKRNIHAGQRDTERHGEELADAARLGLPARDGGPQRPGGIAAEPERRGGDVADPEGLGHPQRRGEPGDLGEQFEAADRGRVPLFAPGPGDPRWADILYREPARAPALEPGVRRVADGPAGPLVGRYELVDRVDRLRSLGNAVVPLAAAYAFRTLKARLEAED